MINVTDITFARQVTLPALRARMGEERGATMVEYGLVLAVVAIAALVGFQFLGDATTDKVCDTATKLESSVSAPAGC